MPFDALVAPRCRARQRGFTLLELMIAVVVVSILAVIALPSFQDSIRKSRRSEAMSALSAVQQAQERWRSNHASYADSVTAAAADGGLAMAGTSQGGYYDLSIESATATGYTATALGKTGTSQANDASCRKMQVRLAGGNLTYAGCGSSSCSFAATNACWAQ